VQAFPYCPSARSSGPFLVASALLVVKSGPIFPTEQHVAEAQPFYERWNIIRRSDGHSNWLHCRYSMAKKYIVSSLAVFNLLLDLAPRISSALLSVWHPSTKINRLICESENMSMLRPEKQHMRGRGSL
jgi:hypothetical protein